ncbi:hypothetical protein Micbo1qcDRAFT_199449 [Microdochium bolleyi]|uniref:RRM domain-containing protein n=1 Tax=Microdochium bolleyi TaxID=196109 RepID=A0A136JHN8_9PEZI|nr:hypothetical protein Micbo1qcDRAFT_199449 [Microdochium bolleyi]
MAGTIRPRADSAGSGRGGEDLKRVKLPSTRSPTPSSGNIWMSKGVLVSTAKTAEQPASSKSAHSLNAGDRSHSSSRNSSKSSGGPRSNFSHRHSLHNPFGNRFSPVINQRGYRFGSTNSECNGRPAQRMKLLKSEEQESCGDGTELAIAENRRVYLGNLLYTVRPAEIEALVREHGCERGYQAMHISIDPFTGRNPSYCFLEFESAVAAGSAQEALNGKMLKGRPVNCRSCQPKGQTLSGRRQHGSEDAFYRWGDYSSRIRDGPKAYASATPRENDRRATMQGPAETQAYRQQASDNVKRCLFVGNLPRMHDQAMAYDEMFELFKGFGIVAASKRFSQRDGKEGDGRRNWQLVDFSTRDEAAAAIKASQGKVWRGARIRLAWAQSKSPWA